MHPRTAVYPDHVESALNHRCVDYGHVARLAIEHEPSGDIVELPGEQVVVGTVDAHISPILDVVDEVGLSVGFFFQ